VATTTTTAALHSTITAAHALLCPKAAHALLRPKTACELVSAAPCMQAQLVHDQLSAWTMYCIAGYLTVWNLKPTGPRLAMQVLHLLCPLAEHNVFANVLGVGPT
jgi:hypothetical protein